MPASQLTSSSGARPPEPVGRARRRPAAVIGWSMVLVGLVLLGWCAWQVWGTTAVSQARHREVVADLERTWAGSTRPSPEDAVVATDFGDATAIVRIPAFGDDYAVPVLEGTSDEVLAAGFGHREGSAAAGGRGNYVIAGHRITHGEPLSDMPQLRAGDEVVVQTAEATYTYVLDTPGGGLTVTDADTWVADPTPENPDPGGTSPADEPRLITLLTCADFTRTPDRLVAFGHLAEVRPAG